MTTNVRDPFENIRTAKANSDKEAEEKRKQYEFNEALRVVIETPEGQVVFRKLLIECGLFTTAFDTNALNMARKEGRREFAQEVFDMVLKAKPEFILSLGNNRWTNQA